jgi:urocanate hydratase
MNGGVALIAEVDETRIQRRIETRYLDRKTDSMEEAMQWVQAAVGKGEPLSIGIHMNAVDVYEWLIAHDPRLTL